MSLRKNPFGITLLALFLCVHFQLFADVNAGAPLPKDILVIRDANDVTNLVNELENKPFAVCDQNITTGMHDGPPNYVTVASSWPASLAGYSQVWDARFDAAGCSLDACSSSLTDSQQADLRNFLAGGGSVFLLGEDNTFPGRDNPLIAFVNSVVASGTFGASGSGILADSEGCCAVMDFAAAAGAQDFGTDYSDLTFGGANVSATAFTAYAGGIRLTELATGRAVYKTAVNDAAFNEIIAPGIAFLPSDLKAPYDAGKLFVWFDSELTRVQQCGPAYCNNRLIRTIMDFLVINDVAAPTMTPTPIAGISPGENEVRQVRNVFKPDSREKTAVVFNVYAGDKTTVQVYSRQGELLCTLYDGEAASDGVKDASWDGRDSGNEVVPSGVYLITVKCGRYTWKGKAAVIR